MNAEKNSSPWKDLLNTTIIVSALGNLVDNYDLLLFNMVRIDSLKSLGLEGEALINSGALLIIIQLLGLIMGGILWGIMGDKKGRIKVLFGSIFLYSIANIGNSYVSSLGEYMIWRFLAGLGLAGEIGAGVTLAVEILSKKSRLYGVMLISATGLAGVMLGGVIVDNFHWRTNYLIAGLLGMALLVARIGLYESQMYLDQQPSKLNKGNYFAFFTNANRFKRYALLCVIGLPIYYLVIIGTFSPELAAVLGTTEQIHPYKTLMWAYGGGAIGNIMWSMVSQFFKTRKWVIIISLGLSMVIITAFHIIPAPTAFQFYIRIFFFATVASYWPIFLTYIAELFGTNLRATASTSIPNLVRGGGILIIAAFSTLTSHLGIYYADICIGAFVYICALMAIKYLPETFEKNLDYLEE